MILNGNEMFDLIRSSLKKRPEDWEFNEYTIHNKKLDVRIWKCNGISHVEVMRYKSTGGVFGNRRLRLTLKQRFIIFSLYLRKIKKLTIFAPIGIVLLYIMIPVLGITMISIHNGNKSECEEELEFTLDKAEYREQRLSQLLEDEI